MRSRELIGPSALVLALATLNPMSAVGTGSSEFRAQGNAREYSLDFPEALSFYRQGMEVQPDDPATSRAVAGIYLFEIAFRRGMVTTDEFIAADLSIKNIETLKPPEELAVGFHDHSGRALILAEQQVRERPDDADAHYQLGATLGLLASYTATVDGEILRAFNFARRASRENGRALELNPQRKDAGLIVGMYQYVVSARAFPVRWLARMAGLKSDKEQGIRLIEEAAGYAGENQTDARFALVLIYNREGRYDDALRVLERLQSRYPRNRLLWLEAGATEMRAGRFARAEAFLNEGLAKSAVDPRPRARGEKALWDYKRGAVRVRLGRGAEAAADLRAALTGADATWVRGRAHAELGRLADIAGDHQAAVLEYRTAVRLGRADADAIGIAEAEQLLAGPATR